MIYQNLPRHFRKSTDLPVRRAVKVRGENQWRCLTTQTQEESQAPRSLIITCESCGKVNYFNISNENEIAEIFNAFQCPSGCEKQYHSYISVGEILLNPTQPPLTRVA